jgi:hypothetical protein
MHAARISRFGPPLNGCYCRRSDHMMTAAAAHQPSAQITVSRCSWSYTAAAHLPSAQLRERRKKNTLKCCLTEEPAAALQKRAKHQGSSTTSVSRCRANLPRVLLSVYTCGGRRAEQWQDLLACLIGVTLQRLHIRGLNAFSFKRSKEVSQTG